jgi:hypothetical protein
MNDTPKEQVEDINELSKDTIDSLARKRSIEANNETNREKRAKILKKVDKAKFRHADAPDKVTKTSPPKATNVTGTGKSQQWGFGANKGYGQGHYMGDSVEQVEVEDQLDEAHKLKDEVVMSYPSLKGVKGHIGEIRHGAYKGAPKTYTIDYQHPKHPEGNMSSIQLSSDQFKAHKPGKLGEEVDEQMDEVSQNSYFKTRRDQEDRISGKLTTKARKVTQNSYFKSRKDQEDKINGVKKSNEEVESLDELSMDTVKSYKEKVSKNPAPSRTTSDILHKAIRRFAGKERAEDRIHSDEMKKMRSRLGIKEETLDEGLVDSVKRGIKSVKRGMQGWDKNAVGPNGEKLGEPKAVVDRVKSRTDDELKSIKDTFTDPKNTFVTRNTSFDNPTKHSPAGLQKRVLDREMKKRGLTSEETLDEVVKTEKPGHKVGDTVYATSPTNKALTMTGKVTKIGATLTTVKHKDGSEAHYPHKLVGKEYSDLHTDPAKKYKQFQREHLEQTGELLTLTEVKYIVENANGGAGVIAQHGGIDGRAPENTGKAKKMMGNKASVDAIVKIIAKGSETN